MNEFGYKLDTIPSGGLKAVKALKRKKPKCIGLFLDGAKGARTPDLLTASQTLSQLSYSPAVLKPSINIMTNRGFVNLRGKFPLDAKGLTQWAQRCAKGAEERQRQRQ